MSLKTLLIILGLTPSVAMAQSEGTIVFSETRQLDLSLDTDEGDEPDPAMEQVRAMVAKMRSQSVQKTLSFSATASLYRNSEGEGDETFENNMAAESGGEMQIQMVVMKPDDRLHVDHATGQVTEQRDFMGKKFLFNRVQPVREWKVGTEAKTIQGYACQQLILKDTGDKVVAWFTPQIKAASGPAGYGGAPGMILELNINDGQRVITASN
ncbi:MAG: GLPGLI family protein, partial [Bacteroidota bacterium]